MLVNFVLGGTFFIVAFLLSQAKQPAIVVTGTIYVWALVYCVSSLIMGRITTPANAGRLIMSGAAGIGICSLGFLFFPQVAAQLLLVGIIGVASAMYCTPFQVFMKAIEPDQNAGIVRSTALYTASWSFGMATGPLVFGLFDWHYGFILNTILGFLMAASIWLIDRHHRSNPVSQRKTPPAPNEVDYSRMPDLAWLGWIIAGCGTVAVCLVRGLIPYQGALLQFGKADTGMILAVVSYVQGLTALALLRSKYWMYRPRPALIAGCCGGLALLLFGLGTSPSWFYPGAVLYGIFSGCCYFYLVFHSLVHPTRSSRYIAVNEIVVGVASILGPITGGLLTGINNNASLTFLLGAVMLTLMAIFSARAFYLGRRHQA
jgi:MFS family permease